MQNLEHIRYISANYSDMQGLRQVPMGLGFLTVGVLSVASSLDIISGMWIIGGMICAVVIGMVVSQYFANWYEATYGAIQSNQTVKRDLIFSLFVILASFVEVAIHSPISLAMIVIAIYYVYRWKISANLVPHNIPLALVSLVAAFMIPIIANPDDFIAWYLIIVGVLITLSGILDHQILTRNLTHIDE